MEPERPPQPPPAPPAPQPWELPAGVGPTRGSGEAPPLGSPSSSYAPPNKRSFLGLGILGIFALLVVGVIAACVIAFFAFRDTITGGLKDVTSAFGGGTPATVVVDGQAMTLQQTPNCHRDSDGMIRMSIDSSQSV